MTMRYAMIRERGISMAVVAACEASANAFRGSRSSLLVLDRAHHLALCLEGVRAARHSGVLRAACAAPQEGVDLRKGK